MSGQATLVGRGDDDADQIRWDRAVCKGAGLLDAMAGDEKTAGSHFKPPRESGESEYQDYQEFKNWGYRTRPADNEYDFNKSLPIERALKALAVDFKTLEDTKDAHNRHIQLEHEDEVKVDCTTYKPTNARFSTIFNKVDGVIMASGAYGARHEGFLKDPKITVLPKLQNWSDLIWLQWMNEAEDQLAGLRYVLRLRIFNKDAEWLISRALRQAKKEVVVWPGVEFSMETDEGKVILASAHGSGVAYLLFTHKRKLGRRTISNVTVFAEDGGNFIKPPSLVYHVVEVPPLSKIKDTLK